MEFQWQAQSLEGGHSGPGWPLLWILWFINLSRVVNLLLVILILAAQSSLVCPSAPHAMCSKWYAPSVGTLAQVQEDSGGLHCQFKFLS